jgi:hypothetical protein
MKTVVQFIRNHRTGEPEDNGRNRMYTRSLRKIGFIDNRYPRSAPWPKHNEHWVVEIPREKQNDKGGCFILKPFGDGPIKEDDLMPLVHGMYTISGDEDAVLITPNDTGKTWVMSPAAKKAILAETPDARALVIVHGTTEEDRKMWQRRRPPESLMEQEAKALLSSMDDD